MKRLMILILILLPVLPAVLPAKEFRYISYSTENAGKVQFDHESHLMKLNNNCPACHNGIFKITGGNPKVTMAEMGNGKSCGACHTKTSATPITACTRCHEVREVPIDIPKFGKVVFSHRFHLQSFSCGDCHNVLFNASTDNPHTTMAEMEKGASCGGCHDGKSAFGVKGDCVRCHTVKEIEFGADAFFSHKFHTGLFKCGDCHSDIFTAGPGATRFTMAQMEKGGSCGACHDGKSAFSVKGDCGKCHKGGREMSFAAGGGAVFSHTRHAPLFKCGDCHSDIFIGGVNSRRFTMEQMEKGQSCGACHDGKTAFGVKGSCVKCHPATKDIVMPVKDAGTVTFSHNFHSGAFKCDDCHNDIFMTGSRAKRFTMNDMKKGQSCGSCHDGKTGFPVSACDRCHQVKDVAMAEDVRFSHRKHLEKVTCSDCHSGIYKPSEDNPRVTMAQMEKGSSCGTCHDGSSAFSVKGSCDRCHRSTVEVVMRPAAVGATPFSHKFHVTVYKCDDCHNGIFAAGKGAKRYTMKEMEQGKGCGACHDDKTAFGVKSNCARCHPVRDIPYKSSGAMFSHKIHVASLSCGDCHTSIYQPGPGNRTTTMAQMEKGESCGACHDGKTVFSVAGDCAKCHKATRAVKYDLSVKEGGVIFSHRVHLGKSYGCTDCHNKIYTAENTRRPVTMQEMQQGKSCGACHGFSMAFKVDDPTTCVRCHTSMDQPAAGGAPRYE